MRKWAILLLMAGTAWPAMAAKSVSIEQFEQMLFANQGKPDQKVADRISDVMLTERVSPARLAKWEKQFQGSRTRAELTELADEAAFLEPPVDDVLRDPAPDNETQERMLALTIDYVRTTIRQLPNFYATRETAHFEDNPSQQMVYSTGATSTGSGMRAMRMPAVGFGNTDYKSMHSTGTTSVMVTYRDGIEVHDTQEGKGKKEDRPPNGLTTSGEFGPILAVVVGDAMRSVVTWARWEQGTSDPVAVFRYAVPEDQSNYSVGIPNGTKIENIYPAYHGEIAIDPATGAILRLSVMAELAPPHEALQTAMLVEYALVEIGDKTYNCPVHGVAFSKIPVVNTAQKESQTVTMQTQLNDVVFRQYHLFRTESRIVMDGGSKSEASPAGPDTTPAPAGAGPEAPKASSSAPPGDGGR
ncbi:MAG: hypothetical protein WBC92_18405 [Terracidiphilus sp.]